jgi:restriction system protein
MEFVLPVLLLFLVVAPVIIKVTVRKARSAALVSAFRKEQECISTFGLGEEAVSVIGFNTRRDPNKFVSEVHSGKQYVDRIIDEHLDYDYAVDAYLSTYFCDADGSYHSLLFASRLEAMIGDLASYLGPPLRDDDFVAYWILKDSAYANDRIMTNIKEEIRERDIYVEDQFLRIESRIKTDIHRHLDTLVRKYHQNVKADDYGNVKTKRFDKELEYVFDNVVLSNLSDLQHEAVLNIPEIRSRAIVVINDEVEIEVNRRRGGQKSFNESMSGREFEHACADVLEASGWHVRRIGGTGDQGVDLVAEGFGVRVALQCKLYAAPVGNKAVQEAFAGKKFEEADIAAVVAKGRYTRAAEELAERSGVLLLHYEDLHVLRDIIRNQVVSKHP